MRTFEWLSLSNRLFSPHPTDPNTSPYTAAMITPQHYASHPCFCCINEKSVALIKSSRPREAADILASGLKLVRTTIASSPGSFHYRNACHPCNSTESQYELHDNVDSLEASRIVASPRPSSATSSQHHHSTISSQSADGLSADSVQQAITVRDFIFSCPMLAPSSNVTTCKNDVTYEHLCFIMIYNLALCYDLLGRGKGGTENDAQVSLGFYQLAYNLQESNNFEIPLVSSCGLLNNMARLYLQSGNHDAASRCLTTLMSVLMYNVTRNQTYGILLDESSNEESIYLAQFMNSALTNVGTESITARAA